MLDFKDKDLYRGKERDFNNFLANVLRTREEVKELEIYEHSDDVTDEALVELAVEKGTTIEGFIESVTEDVKDDGNDTSFFIEDKKLGTPYEMNHFWKNLAVSPYYLFYYIARSVGSHIGERGSLEKYMKSLMGVSGITSAITLILLFFTDAKFIFSLPVQAIASVTLFVVSYATMLAIQNPGLMKIRLVNDDDLTDHDTDKKLDGASDYGSGDVDESELDLYDDEESAAELEAQTRAFAMASGMDPDEAVALMGSLNFNDLEQLNNSSEADADVVSNEVRTNDVSVNDGSSSHALNPGKSPVPHSTVDVNHKGEDFLNDLREVYERNAKYTGQRFTNRKDLVISLSDYLIANDKSFGSWNELEERGVVYNNIMYTLYLALGEINSAYPKSDESLHVFKVLEAKENPLMYKIEIEVPRSLFKEGQLKSVSGQGIFKSRLRKSDDDMDVRYIISSYQEGFVVKLFKAAKGLVSLGDIVRYHDEDSTETQAYEHFLGDKMGLPMILGLRNNEYPTVIDLADNTSAVIAGESGSGKSWGTFLVVKNMVYTNDYNNLNIIIMDKKKSVFWREFARLPHVTGYHTNVPDYFDILKEIKEEMELRKMLLQSLNQEDWKGLRKSVKKRGDVEAMKAFPWLVVIMDEISNTMKEILSIAGEDNKHIYDSFLADLTQLAQEGRSLGIKLMLIGQRTIANSMPKDVMLNSSMKFGFKLSVGDMERLVGTSKEVAARLPSNPGEAYLSDFNAADPMFLRTLTVGGTDNDQITNLIRILAFEWTRRSEGDVLVAPTTMPFTYNRPVIREKVLEDMANGKLFIGGEDDGDDFDNVVQALLSGSALPSKKEKDLIPVTIMKEDKFGNVLDADVNKDVIDTPKIVARKEPVVVSKGGAPTPGSRKAVVDYTQVEAFTEGNEVKVHSDMVVRSESDTNVTLPVIKEDVVEEVNQSVVRDNSMVDVVLPIRVDESNDFGDADDVDDDAWAFMIGDEDMLPDEKPREEDPVVVTKKDVPTDVRGNVTEKVELTNDEFHKWDNVVRDQSNAPKRKMMGSVVRKSVSEVGGLPNAAREKAKENLRNREDILNAPEDGDAKISAPERGGLSVPSYIKTYGEGVGTKKMPRDVVSKVFTKAEIERALSSLLIVKDGDTYQA